MSASNSFSLTARAVEGISQKKKFGEPRVVIRFVTVSEFTTPVSVPVRFDGDEAIRAMAAIHVGSIVAMAGTLVGKGLDSIRLCQSFILLKDTSEKKCLDYPKRKLKSEKKLSDALSVGNPDAWGKSNGRN